MTDYDRGAYTPQTDAPLAFDPRRPSERRPMPMALLASGVVLVVLLAGVAMVYRGGVRHAGESPRPVGEPVMAVKTAPPAAQTAAASGAPANLDVYSAGGGDAVASASPAANTVAAASGPAPTLAPSPEQPAARPAPSAATVALLAKPSAPTHIERPAIPSEAGAALSGSAPKNAHLSAPARVPVRARLDEGELAAAGATRTTPRVTAAQAETGDMPSDAVAHPAKPTVQTAPSPPVAAGAGKAVVQIGAFSSTALADKGYADVSAALPAQMGGKAKHVLPLDKGGSTLYRTWLSGFASRADAVAFCDALKARSMSCFVKGS